MAIEVRPVSDKRDLNAFLKIPFDIYKYDHNWVAPLFMEQRDLLSEDKNPWFEHGRAQLFIAYRDGQPVGRISAQVDSLHVDRHDNAGFFGFFECPNDRAVSKALFEAAESWLSEQGVEISRGPFSLSINEYSGFLVDGWDYPPMILMTHNPPYYNDLVTKQGYSKCKDLWAWYYDITKPIPEMAEPVADQVLSTPGLVLRPFDMKNFDRDIQIMQDIFNEAWANNWGYVPLTENEVRKMAKDLKLILVPEAAVIAELDGDPAGICLSLPDLNEALYGLNGRLFPGGMLKLLWRLKVKGLKSMRLVALGVRKKYRGAKLGGLSIALYVDIHRRARAMGYERGELGWTLEDNKKINQGIEFMGGKVYKTYRIYEKSLSNGDG